LLTDRRSRSRRLVGSLLIAATALTLASCAGDDGTTLGESADIVIDNMGFTPDEATIKVGQEVVFSVLNKDTREHTFTLPFIFTDLDNFIDEPIAPGERIEVKIKATEVPRDGFYSFYSKSHQDEGYQGRIEVTE